MRAGPVDAQAEDGIVHTVVPRGSRGGPRSYSAGRGILKRHGMQVLIADDHPILLQALSDMLTTADPSVVLTTAASMEEVASLLDQGAEFDLALIDFNMPGGGDMARIKDLIDRHPAVKVAVISGNCSPQLVRSALDAGAQGFILKTMAPAPMLHAIRMMAEGGRHIPDILLTSGSDAFGADKSATGMGGREGYPFGLTDREFACLKELSGGLSNKGIARNLSVQEVTVKLHLRRAFRKLGVHNRAEAVRVALEAGIRKD